MPSLMHLWRAPDAVAGRDDAGFASPADVRHATVFAPSREQGAYNHHPQLACHADRFWAIWSNHPHGEDGPGQRLLYSSSPDGLTWQPAGELMPPPVAPKAWRDRGLALTAGRLLVVGDELYAVALCHDNVGYEDASRSHRQAQHDADHIFRARRGFSSLARRIAVDGSLGAIFPLAPEVADLAFATSPCAAAAARVNEALTPPDQQPTWDFSGRRPLPAAHDGRRLCEPVVYRRTAGSYTMFLRDDSYSHRLFVSHSADGRDWSDAQPTDIPDSPSLSTVVCLAAGAVLLIGNQMAPPETFDRPALGHLSRSPLTVSYSPDGEHFTHVYALRSGVQQYRIPQSAVGGRGGGGQYPSAIVHGDRLYVLYAMGKEDICCSQVPLASVLASPAPAHFSA